VTEKSKTNIVNYAINHIRQAGGLGTGQKQRGKFVLICSQRERFVVFSSFEQVEFHANIVDQFVSEHQLKGHYNKKGDAFYIDTEQWTVSGGGHWEWDLEAGELLLGGRSIAYGSLDLKKIASEVQQSRAFGEIQVKY